MHRGAVPAGGRRGRRLIGFGLFTVVIGTLRAVPVTTAARDAAVRGGWTPWCLPWFLPALIILAGLVLAGTGFYRQASAWPRVHGHNLPEGEVPEGAGRSVRLLNGCLGGYRDTPSGVSRHGGAWRCPWSAG